MLRGAFLLLLAAAGLSGWAWCAAAPSVQRLEPLGLRPGTTSRLTVVGDNLSGAIDLWSSFASEIAVDDREKEVGFNVTVPSDTTPGIGALRFIGTNGASSPHLLLIDPMPAVPSWGTNRSSLAAQAVAVPGAVDAVCAEVRSDYYRFTGKRGQRLTVEVVAQRIASPLDPYLRILDLDRRELAETDDTPGLGSDPRIDFKCPRSGAYLIEVRDTRYGGGPRYRYRLRLGEPLPAPLPFLLKRELAAHTSPLEEPPRLIGRAPSGGPGQCRLVSWPAIIEGSFSKANQRDAYELTVAQGDLLLLSGRTRSLGSPCDLFLQLQTTNGTKIAEANANSADEGMLTNRFNESGPCRLIVEELNGRAGSTLRYEVRLAKAGPGFSLATRRVHRPGSARRTPRLRRADQPDPGRAR